MTIEPTDVARILGGEETLHRCVRTPEDLREAVESGLPRTALDRAVRRACGDSPEAIELEHSIVPKTTIRRRRGWLNAEEGQRLMRLARMTAAAEGVWRDPVLVRQFLTRPQPELGGERPIDLARSDSGTGQVEDLLSGPTHPLPV